MKAKAKTKAVENEANKRHAFSMANLFIAIAIIFTIALLSLGKMALADPNPSAYENWKTDFTKTIVPNVEIISGGVIKDQIPAIDDPKFVNVDKATNLKDLEPVITLEHNGVAKAYPLQIMTWHEIVNDRVGGDAFAVTFCPLCNAALVFDATIEGEVHSFGTTGRLRNSDLLMYDRVTESWFQQFTGEALIGEYAGKKLKLKPSRLESWASFKERHPDGLVLVPNRPDFRPYGRNPYVGYDARNAPYPLYTGDLPDYINPMERVVVLRKDENASSILSLEKIRNEKILEQDGFIITWSAGQASALSSAQIAEGKDVGNLTVQVEKNGKLVDAVHDITFAFVAHAFHPKIKIIK
ncbi:MAG: DUF3179 domain-containing protein [Nitratireductor sp.]